MTTHEATSAPVSVFVPSRRRWLIASILFLAVLSAFFDRISVAVLFTNVDFQDAMGTGFNPTLLGLLMTAFVSAYGLSGLFLSFVGDIYGPRRSLMAGAALWGVAMASMGAAGSFATMLSLRMLLGLAEGPQFALTNSLIKRWFPAHEQARANSIWMIGSPLGSAIGFPLMIYLETTFGWRSAFLALAALNVIVIMPLVWAFVSDRPETPAHVPVMSQGSGRYLDDVGLFVRDWRFWMVVIFNSAALIYLWGLNSWLPTYLVKVRHFAPTPTGLFSSLPFIAMFLGEVLTSALSDRLGRRAIVCFASLFMAGVLMYTVSLIPDPHAAVVVMSLSAFCWGSALPSLFALAAQLLPVRALAAGVGVFNGIGNIVGAFSPLAVGALITMTGSFDSGLAVLVGAAVVGSMAMLPLARHY